MNFDRTHFETSANEELAQHRMYPVMDPDMTISENRDAEPYIPLRPEAQEAADHII